MKKELNFAKSVIRGRITGEKIPLVAAFELTQLCNLTCDYCDVWAKQSRDLSTTQIKEIISGLAEVGTYSVSFDGGEALMRKDVGEIVDHTHSVGIPSQAQFKRGPVSRSRARIEEPVRSQVQPRWTQRRERRDQR